MQDHSPVILFFVRWPEPGRVKTRLAASVGAEEACRIHRALAEQCLAQARIVPGACVVVCGTGAPAESFRQWLPGASDYWEQPEGDLGRRLELLFARAFSREASTVVAIGSDAPALDAGAIGEAIAAMESHDVVLLPALDGGYVLIGLGQHLPTLFRQMPWSTDRLFAQTLDICTREKLRTHLGGLYRDVDTLDDWQIETGVRASGKKSEKGATS